MSAGISEALLAVAATPGAWAVTLAGIAAAIYGARR